MREGSSFLEKGGKETLGEGHVPTPRGGGVVVSEKKQLSVAVARRAGGGVGKGT